MQSAQVVVLAGPSGAGKSRLAERLGLPILRLDDFYKDGDDPTLPRITSGANAGIVDWDHPDSWRHDDALRAIEELCRTGRTEVPIYEIALNGRTGSRPVDLAGRTRFVAEGIFAPEIVAECRRSGLLAAAYCITQHPLVTFWRRLTRDLREHRKPPVLLLRRGLDLLRDQRRVVAHAVERGCRQATGDRAYAELTAQREPSAGSVGLRLHQPDGRSCGAAALVMARRSVHPTYAGLVTGQATFAHEVSTLHHRLTSLSDTAGGWQVPWLRVIGTPPWAVARELRLLTGVRHEVRPVRPVRLRRHVWSHLHRATPERPVVVFVGDRFLPRHVVLVTGVDGGHARTYEPASGRVVGVDRDRWERGDLRLAGWDRPWLVVSPA